MLFLNVYYEHASYADIRAAGSIQIPGEDFVYNYLEWLEEMTDEYITEAVDYCIHELDNLALHNEGTDCYLLAWDNKPKA